MNLGKVGEFFGFKPAQGEYIEDYVEDPAYDVKYKEGAYPYDDPTYGDEYMRSGAPGSTPLPPLGLGPDRYGSPEDKPYRAPRPTAHISTVSPQDFVEVELIGRRFRENTPVVVNLRGIEKPLKQRIVDFCSGLVFALDGTIERPSQNVFLLKPAEAVIDDAELRRIEQDYQ